jgi:membrane protease YdiL (CAAX protease family)
MILRAIASGVLIGLIAANVWPVLFHAFGAPAVFVEFGFLAGYLWWASGHGPPARLAATRVDSFRATRMSVRQWSWGVLAAVGFAGTIHSSLILLFRLVPFPAQAFHSGYDLSFIESVPTQWLVCVVGALSAAVCEETGFRGYMQRPLEIRLGPWRAILTSSVFFTLLHLNQAWAAIGVLPIVLAAGLLLGWLASASGSLLFGMIGHWLMDIGLFAYWWAQIAGSFSQRPISESGPDLAFAVECAAPLLAFAILRIAIHRLRKLSIIEAQDRPRGAIVGPPSKLD